MTLVGAFFFDLGSLQGQGVTTITTTIITTTIITTITTTTIIITMKVAGKSHFTSWHGKFGLAACVGSLLAAVGGVAAKYR